LKPFYLSDNTTKHNTTQFGKLTTEHENKNRLTYFTLTEYNGSAARECYCTITNMVIFVRY